MIWDFLCQRAAAKKKATYTQVATLIGDSPRRLTPELQLLHRYCAHQNTPFLTVLVVQKASGEPGGGFDHRIDVKRETARCFRKDWSRATKPTIDMMLAAELLP